MCMVVLLRKKIIIPPPIFLVRVFPVLPRPLHLSFLLFPIFLFPFFFSPFISLLVSLYLPFLSHSLSPLPLSFSSPYFPFFFFPSSFSPLCSFISLFYSFFLFPFYFPPSFPLTSKMSPTILSGWASRPLRPPASPTPGSTLGYATDSRNSTRFYIRVHTTIGINARLSKKSITKLIPISHVNLSSYSRIMY